MRAALAVAGCCCAAYNKHVAQTAMHVGRSAQVGLAVGSYFRVTFATRRRLANMSYEPKSEL